MDTAIHTPVTSLKDRRILVTGGTTGIGRAIVRLMASEGARVFTFGRHKAELDDALQSTRDLGASAVDGMVADAASARDIARVFEASDSYLGGLDVLIDNAAVTGEGIADMANSEWRYAVEANLVGYMACAREAASRMQKGGHIVMIGSVSADIRGADSSVYVATKAGVQGFAEAFRKEMIKPGIKVSLIEPGTVGSDLDGASPQAQRQAIRRHEMLRAEDIAVAVHFVLTQPERTLISSMQVLPRMEED
jgi:NADP-dependent 3-hydroxy acid dehydrogenase YdfG